MNSKHILSIKNAEDLFSSPELVKMEFHALAKKWHPDIAKNEESNKVFAHINALYIEALKKIEHNSWHSKGVLIVSDKNGHTYKVKYKKETDFDFGKMYISDSIIFYLFSNEFNEFGSQFIKNISNFNFANDKMREEFSRYLPSIKTSFLTDKEEFGLVIPKTKDQFRLLDVFETYTTIDPKHVAWMIGSLLNICCYLSYNKSVHADITLNSCFVSPQYHTISLLGNWWHMKHFGEKLTTVSPYVYDLLPNNIKKTKEANHILDLELVKAIGRTLLGDITGNKIIHDKNIPASLSEWLLIPAQKNAFDEYEQWIKRILPQSFGERKFVEFQVDSKRIYN